MIIAPVIANFEKWCSRFPWAVRLYSLPYRTVLDREIGLAGITEDDVVLNIGCGSVPFTAIYIAAVTGARVHAVDIDESALICARRCTAAAGLDDRVTYEHASGESTSCREFTAAVTALQARPKAGILAHLLRQGSSDVRIIFRKPQPRLHSQYDMIPGSYPISGEVIQNMKTFVSSVLYTHMPGYSETFCRSLQEAE